MRVRAITTILLTAILAVGVTACGTSHTTTPTPTAAPTTTAPATPSPAPTVDTQAAVEACATALAADPGGATPTVCTKLSVSEYMAAMQASNQAGRDKLASAIASAAAAASDQP